MLLATEADRYVPPVSAYVPIYHLLSVVGTLVNADPTLLTNSLIFSVALLSILAAHEAGHYVACRLYGVEASLPYFIPAPPPFPTGTFGAFIKIRAPVPHRRALFDIAVAGPLAGFALIVPVAFVALLSAQPAPAPPPDVSLIYFNDPLLFRLSARMLDVSLASIAPNPFYFAAWFGLLVTSLNLIPVGQLDGGHITYVLFGARAHRRLGGAAFVVVCLLAPLGWWWHNVPSNILYAVLLLIMLRVRHPQAVYEGDALGNGRLVLAIITLVVLALSFQPFPFTIT